MTTDNIRGGPFKTKQNHYGMMYVHPLIKTVYTRILPYLFSPKGPLVINT